MNIDPHDWSTLQPVFDELINEPLTLQNVRGWLTRWSDVEKLLQEATGRAYRAKMEDTTNEKAEAAFINLLENVIPKARVAENALHKKLVGLAGFDDAEHNEFVRRVKAQLELFREENIPLFVEIEKLGVEYDKLIGGLVIDLDGKELTMYEALAKLIEPNRDLRERAYMGLLTAWRGVRSELENVFMQMLALRRQIAKNAGFANYREYIWKEKSRFDYSPEDCLTFHQSILDHIVPITTQVFEQRRQQMGLSSLTAWDTEVDPRGLEPLRPYNTIPELEAQLENVFKHLSIAFGQMFGTLRHGDLDLGSRKGKGPGGYCDFFPASNQAYIFMNAVGVHDDVQVLLHEGGHAFHAIESAQAQPFVWNLHGPMEFCEVASMGMEMLAQPYLDAAKGGFYSPTDAARARAEHLFDAVLVFLPYMACVDAFQHWIYVDAPEDVTMDAINAKWQELHAKFKPHVDYSGLPESSVSRWQRQGHIFTAPFYYIEYGIAQLGAVQVWDNALKDETLAVQQYRAALRAGYTKGLKDLFETAGLKLAFDGAHVAHLAKLVSSAIEA
jgi:oligoendopeptidase F